MIQAKTNSLNRAKWIELNGFKEINRFMQESEVKINHSSK